MAQKIAAGQSPVHAVGSSAPRKDARPPRWRSARELLIKVRNDDLQQSPEKLDTVLQVSGQGSLCCGDCISLPRPSIRLRDCIWCDDGGDGAGGPGHLAKAFH
eukprot:1369884-Rhodomonas_salina.6